MQITLHFEDPKTLKCNPIIFSGIKLASNINMIYRGRLTEPFQKEAMDRPVYGHLYFEPGWLMQPIKGHI